MFKKWFVYGAAAWMLGCGALTVRAEPPAALVAQWHVAAENGNAWAQCNLGTCYFFGDGVPRDYRTAAFWFHKAAAQGLKEAQNGLAVCHVNGFGVPRDYQSAVFWYRKSAEQGCADAQFGLGECYDNGWGVPKDPERAVFWYRKAAAQGTPKAQQKLMAFNSGHGQPQRGNTNSQFDIWTLTPQQLDSMLASAPPEKRELMIRSFWQATFYAFATEITHRIRHITPLAPVIKKYDPMFDAHAQECNNEIFQFKRQVLPSSVDPNELMREHFERSHRRMEMHRDNIRRQFQRRSPSRY